MYYGSNCERANLCHSSPCKNDGRCVNTSNWEYACRCPRGYYGANCESYNPCAKAQCENGARCLNVSTTEYECLCSESYYFGQYCQHFNR